MITSSAPRPKINVARVAARYAARREETVKEDFNDATAQEELLEVISVTSETRARANAALGFATKVIEAPAPTEAPTEAPLEKPDVWNMPTTGIGWGCDCEEDSQELDADWLNELAEDISEDPEWMTHEEVLELAQEFWEYEDICTFFRMIVGDSAKAVNGKIAEKYKFTIGVEIVAYFSKVWNGCPEEACGMGDSSGEDEG
jgi:hypothetical protein